MNELKRINQVLAQLMRQQARGGLTYQRAVDVEILISAFQHIRAEKVAETGTGRSVAPAFPDSVLDVFLRGLDT